VRAVGERRGRERERRQSRSGEEDESLHHMSPFAATW
jgi:hypothetical protein